MEGIEHRRHVVGREFCAVEVRRLAEETPARADIIGCAYRRMLHAWAIDRERFSGATRVDHQHVVIVSQRLEELEVAVGTLLCRIAWPALLRHDRTRHGQVLIEMRIEAVCDRDRAFHAAGRIDRARNASAHSGFGTMPGIFLGNRLRFDASRRGEENHRQPDFVHVNCPANAQGKSGTSVLRRQGLEMRRRASRRGRRCASSRFRRFGLEVQSLQAPGEPEPDMGATLFSGDGYLTIR